MLKVECESCKAPYQVDERRVPDAGLKMRCPKCGHTFLVTDPSKAASGGAAGAVPPKPVPKKATMVGVGAFAKPPAPAPKAAPAPPAGGFGEVSLDGIPEDEMALPAVKPAAAKPGRPAAAPPALDKPTAPALPAQKGAPPAVLPNLDDLDLPALAGDVGLPAVAKKPAAKPAANQFSFEMELPTVTPETDFGEAGLPAAKAVPARGQTQSFGDAPKKPAGGGFGDLPSPKGSGFGDLPAPKAAGGFGDLPSPKGSGFGDLPAPKAAGGFGDLPSPRGSGFGDLPSPKGGFGDLPSPKGGFGDLPSPKGGGGFGELDGFDLPIVQNNLPSVGGGLPSPRGGGLGGGFGEIDLPQVQNDLPSAMGANAHLPSPMGAHAHLPSAMGPNAHLPSPMGPHAHLPSPSASLPMPAGPQSHMPSPVSDDRLLPKPMAFGELDLPLVGTGQGLLPSAAIGSLPPASARPADPVSFGELDLPADPSLAMPSPAGSASGAPPAMGGMAFGEVDLGGGGGGDPGAVPLGPPPATSAGSFAFQEASLESKSQPPPRRERTAPAEDRTPSKAPKILAVILGIVVVGGAALQFLPSVGAFGYIAIGDKLNAGNYVKQATIRGDEARKKLAIDTFKSSQTAADELADAKKRSPRSRPLAAYAGFVEYMVQIRFGADASRAARVNTFLSEMPPGTEVPYLHAAQAAQAGAAGEWDKAKQLTEVALMREPKDGITQELYLLKGEIALAQHDATGAVAAFNQAAASGANARTSFGLARAYFATKSYAKTLDAVEGVLKTSPTHAGALTLRGLVTWEDKREDAAALKDISAVLDDKVRPTLGPSEISQAFAAKGWIMLARDRAGDARAAFDEAVKIDPRNVSALVGQGEVLYADGRYTEALTRFEEAVQKDATNIPAVIGAAKTKIALERLADAKAQLTAARQRAPKDMGIALWLARTEEALGNKKVAEELYGVAIDLADPQNPDSIQAYATYARFLASQGRTSDAQAKLDQARAKLPDSAALQRAFGEVAALQGQHDEAVAHFQAALQKNPNDLGTRFRLGAEYRKMHKLDQAAQELDNVAAIDKEYPGIALERGILFEESGDVQKALEQFESARQKAPNDPDLNLRVGAAYVAIGEVDKALPMLSKVKDQRPNSAEANHFIGRAYLKQGGLESAAAMRYLQRAVDLDPNKAEYHLYVAWAANESTPAQLGLARKHVDKALALDRLLADGYWQRGVVSRREGQVNDAIKDLKRALELKPSRHEAHAALAECYEDKNDTAGAMAEWQRAIVGDDKQASWRWRYGRLLAEKNQNAEAAKHLAFAVAKGKAAQPRPGWLGPASFEAGEVLRKTGQKKEACEHYALFMELASPTSPDRRDAIKWQNDLGCPWEGR